MLLPATVAAAECQFVLGFATLRDLIGHEIVGECLENERYAANGNSEQQTSGGLLVWRKADNRTAFSDGYRTWINGPNGLEQRLNTERFAWEADYAPSGGIATPISTQTPVNTATPVPAETPSPTSTPVPASAPTLIELAMAAPWYRDGLSDSESRLLIALKQIDEYNPQSAKKMTTWTWIFDEELLATEQSIVGLLARYSGNYPDLVFIIVELSWLRDGIDRWEMMSIEHLLVVASNYNLDFAKELAAAPWVVDGITLIESHLGLRPFYVLSLLPGFSHSSPRIGRQILGLIPNSPEEVDLFLVSSLIGIAQYNPDGFNRLMEASWLRDGLNVDERRYLIAAAASRLNNDQLFAPYKVESARLHLPHSGTVNVWVVHRLSASSGRRILADLEEAVRDNERFWGLPFPMDNVALSLLTGTREFGSGPLGDLITLKPHSAKPDFVHRHVAGYYFSFGPNWLSLGGGVYVRDYFHTSHAGVPRPQYTDYCRRNGFKNLHALSELSDGAVSSTCTYGMGMHFLVALRNTMGEKPWLSALRTLYQAYGYESLFHLGEEIDDATIYRAFIEHAPANLKAKVKDVFRTLHGGPFVD